MEFDDIFYGSALEAVNRLVVVADNEDVWAFEEAAEEFDGFVLGGVGVLVFVDEDVLVAFLIFAEEAGEVGFIFCAELLADQENHVFIVVAFALGHFLLVEVVGFG